MVSSVVVSRPALAAVAEEPSPAWGVASDGFVDDGTDARIRAIAVTGTRVYLGGEFTQAMSAPDPVTGAEARLARRNLVALDLATGVLDPLFVPEPDGPVWSLAVSEDGTRLFVGGGFGQIGGGGRDGLAAVDLMTGSAVPGWRAQADGGIVSALEVGNGRLYAGGKFTGIADSSGLHARSRLAALDPGSGDVDPNWTPSADDFVRSLRLTPDGSRVVVGGEFLSLNGQARESLGAVDAFTGVSDATFSPGGVPRVFDIDADGSRLYVVMGGGGGQVRALDPRTGRTQWSVRGNGDFQAVAVLGDLVYVGGHFGEGAPDAFGGLPRDKLAAVRVADGAVDAFSPNLNSRLGVWSLVTRGKDLFVGGDFTRLNGVTARHYARLQGPPEPPGAPPAPRAVAGAGSVELSWTPPSDDGGSAIGSYVVAPFRNGTPEASRTFASAATTATVAGLVNGASYTFTVAAVTAAGPGPASPASAPVMPVGVPGAPVGVTVGSPDDGAATIGWSPPADDGGTPISAWVVTPYRDEVAQATRVVSSEAVPAQGGPVVSSRVLSLRVSGLANGASYRFAVAAVNGAGTGPASILSVAVVPRTVPEAPTAVTAGAGDGRATVTWQAPPDDGGSAVSGYVVTPVRAGAPQRPLVFASTATTLTITGLDNTVPYTFTVAALNAAGTGAASAPSAPVAPRSGYWMLGRDGRVYSFGQLAQHGDAIGAIGSGQAVDIAASPSSGGYWVLDRRGGVHPFGDAAPLGGMPAGLLRPGEQATSLSGTPSGAGYWVFTSTGRVFPFGDAPFLGDMSATPLNGAVVDSVATPRGDGYYMVGSDGGIFTFGGATFAGSMGAARLNAPVRAMVPDPDGDGYWLVATDGGVFAFRAAFRGSMGATRLNQPVTAMVQLGNGYLMVGADGGIFNFSDRPFHGSLGGTPPTHPIVSVAGMS